MHGKDSKVGEITRKGDYYRVSGKSGEGRPVQIDVPVRTLDSMDRRSADAFLKRSIHGVAGQEG